MRDTRALLAAARRVLDVIAFGLGSEGNSLPIIDPSPDTEAGRALIALWALVREEAPTDHGFPKDTLVWVRWGSLGERAGYVVGHSASRVLIQLVDGRVPHRMRARRSPNNVRPRAPDEEVIGRTRPDPVPLQDAIRA